MRSVDVGGEGVGHMGKGVVSLLDAEHTALVGAIWTELEGTLGIEGLSGRILPHISYHVADDYDGGALEARLRTVAARRAPYLLRITGLGIFTGPAPILYLSVLRTPEIEDFHRELWSEISQTATGVSDYFRSENWVPHVTLASGLYLEGGLGERLGDVVSLLGSRPLLWEVPLDNLTLLRSSDETGGSQEVVLRVQLSGREETRSS